MIKNILIFAGGKGTRLGEITKKTPKPMIIFNNRPFLDFILSQLANINAENIFLLTCYKSALFFKKYHNRKIKNSKIKCIKEKNFYGTSGSLYHSKKLIKNNTLVCNGDTYFKYNFKNLNKINLKQKLIYLICVNNKNYKSNTKLTNLNLKNNIIYYDKKSKLMNSGFYVINKKIIKFLKKKGSLENDILPELIFKNKIIGKRSKSTHVDIGTPKNLILFKKKAKKIEII